MGSQRIYNIYLGAEPLVFEHIVLFKPKATTTRAQEDELIHQLVALRTEIPTIVDISAGRTVTERAKGYTIGLVVRFEDQAGLDVYQPHPAHQRVVAYVREIIDDVIAVDYPFSLATV